MHSIESKIISLFTIGINAVKPDKLIEKSVVYKNATLSIKETGHSQVVFDLTGVDHIFVIGAGKASALMAQKIEEVLGDKITAGVVVTKYGFTAELQKIRLLEAAHPVPDANGIKASQAILELCKKAGKSDLIINLLSGGASALLPLPVDGITLAEKTEVTKELLKSGARIGEINFVRRHLSKLKGGGLLNAICPAKIITLLVSDVVGNKLDIIGSGITVPVKRDFKACWKIVENYNLQATFPKSVIAYLRAQIQENKRATGHPICKNQSNNIVIGNNLMALNKIKIEAENWGYKTTIVNSAHVGEAKIVGRKIAEDAIAFAKTQAVKGVKYGFLYGGETTVTIKGDGDGGRNQELVLAAAMALNGAKGITILSGGTDGNDGPTDAAGAICNGETIRIAEANGMNAADYLNKNDSYNFFKKINSLLITGPTGTNVMDIQIVLIEV